jgi:hypothetical protein
MTRNLRAIAPKRPFAKVVLRARRSTRSLVFFLAIIAILLQFLLPYVVIDTLGVPSRAVKLHPATLLVLAAGVFAMAKGDKAFATRCKESPCLMVFVLGMPAITAYSMFLVGFSGSAVYPETYWSAAMLAVMLETATDRQRRFLGWLLIALCVFNVFIALYEAFTYSVWFPLVIDPDKADAASTVIETDFRPNALFNHPLTASLITTMAVFALYGMRLRLVKAAPLAAILLIGLLTYGGRTALAVTLVSIVGMAGFQLFYGILRRNLKFEFVIGMLIGAIALPLLMTVVVTQTNLADRIMDTLYYDDSAAVRATQWHVLNFLQLKNWLFGISPEDLAVLKYQIGLGSVDTDIENFWLLMFLNLGALGFAVFLYLLTAFCYHLGKYSRSPYGWVMVLTSILIDSGSNSLGVKSSDLFVLVAFIYAMPGFQNYVAPIRVTRRPPAPQRLLAAPTSAVALSLVPINQPRGLRLL